MNKVFIIEDDVKINEQLGSFLKKYGYEAVRKRINGEVTRVIGLPYKYRKFDL